MKTINNIEYRVNPFGIEIPMLDGSPVAVETVADTLPKVEKRAMSPDLTPAQREALNDPETYLRNKMKTDLLYLMRWGFEFPDINPASKYLRELAQFLKRPARRKAVIVPREHLKTTFGVSVIGQDLLNNPMNTWLICSSTFDLAKSILKVLKNRLLSPWIVDLFGNLQGDTWSTEAMDIKGYTPSFQDRSNSVNIAGIGTSITGLHPKNALLDDLVGDQNYDTAEKRQAVIDYYEDLLFVIKDDILANMTVWHYADWSMYLRERNMLLDDGDPIKYKFFFRSVYDKDTGEVLFPELRPKEWVEEKRRQMGSLRFSCQMMNQPHNPDDLYFNADILKQNQFVPTKEWWNTTGNRLKFYMTVDPAYTQQKYSDFTGIVVCGVDEWLNIYVIDAWNKKEKPDKVIDQIFNFVRLYNPELTGIEQKDYECSYKKPINDRKIFQNVNFTVRPLKYGAQPGSKSPVKGERIKTLVPYVEGGMIHINAQLKDLIDQMETYPACKHDDLVDALAYQLQLIPRPSPPQFRTGNTLSRFTHWIREQRKPQPYAGGVVKYLNVN